MIVDKIDYLFLFTEVAIPYFLSFLLEWIPSSQGAHQHTDLSLLPHMLFLFFAQFMPLIGIRLSSTTNLIDFHPVDFESSYFYPSECHPVIH